jgi:hypoxanthine phosphoribosyltransferase
MSQKRELSSSSSKPEVVKRYLCWDEYYGLVVDLAEMILQHAPGTKPIYLIGIPRAGGLLALLMTYLHDRFFMFDQGAVIDPKRAHIFVVDDILDTGTTRKAYGTLYPWAVLIDKSPITKIPPADLAADTLTHRQWVVFPYEVDNSKSENISRKARGYD